MKPLSPSMIDILMTCHEKELQHQAPVSGISSTQQVKGLVLRKFLDSRMDTNTATGKKIMTFFITKDGKSYLDKYIKKTEKA